MTVHQPRVRWTEGLTTALITYQTQGMSAREISEQLGISRLSVSNRLAYMGRPSARPKPSYLNADTLIAMARMWTDGADAEAIGVAFGVGKETVYKIAAAHRSQFPRRGSGKWRLNTVIYEDKDDAGEERVERPGTYQWRHPDGDLISLPVVRGYTPGVPAEART